MATKSAIAKSITRPKLLAHLEALTAAELFEAVTVAALRRAVAENSVLEPPAPKKKKPSAKPAPKKKKKTPSEKPKPKPRPQKKPSAGNNKKPSKPVPVPDTAVDREQMSRDAETGRRSEGFWASSQNPDEDQYKGAYPWPVPHSHPFKGETVFLDKLRAMQTLADRRARSRPDSGLTVSGSRGFAPSRLESSVKLGNETYVDIDANIEWTDALLNYYIGRYHVRPTREFYDYVLTYPLPAGGSGGETEAVEEKKEKNLGEREYMARKPDGGARVEGYWASSPDPAQDDYDGAYPWPVAQSHPWKGEAAFLVKLRAMEAEATKPKKSSVLKVMRGLHVEASRGRAPSRLEPQKMVGNRSYVDYDAGGLEWTEALGDYYVANFHVQPSREFIDYVMAYRL
jgi:hypothetical protein